MTKVTSYEGLPYEHRSIEWESKKTFGRYNSKTYAFVHFDTPNNTTAKVRALGTKPFQFPLSKLIWGEKYAPIYIKDNPNPLFVKIAYLSQALGISQKALQEATADPQAISRLIGLQKNLNEALQAIESPNTLDKVQRYMLQKGPSETKFVKDLVSLAPHLKPETIGRLLSDTRIVDNEKMRQTISHIGQMIKNLNKGDELYVKKETDRYGYSITSDGQIYIRYTKVGEGGFKKVSNALELTNLDDFVSAVIKDNSTRNIKAIREIQKEQSAFKKLKGIDHIVPPYEIVILRTTKAGDVKVVAIQRKMNGDCENIAQKQVSPYHVLSILGNVAEGVSQMHKRGLIHNDLKPANILFKGDLNNKKEPVQGYVHDFGLMTEDKNLETGKKGTWRGGTPNYHAPEIFERQKNGLSLDDLDLPKLDSYALGVTVIEMVTGLFYVPGIKAKFFADASQDEINQFISQKKVEIESQAYLSTKEKKIQFALLDLATDLIAIKPEDRLSCQQASDQLQKLMVQFPFSKR